MKIRFLGQGGIQIHLGGFNLVVDPFITGNPLSTEIDVDTIPCDYLLLTHGHQDHVVDVEKILDRTSATLISNYEIVTYYGEKGYKGHPMNHGGKWNFEFGTLKQVNAIHSSVLPDGTYAGNPVGFVIDNTDHCFYIAGDTALTLDMKLIPMTSRKLDFAVLPVGDNFTMGYEDAIIASDFIECNEIYGYHYDTFGYIEIDHQAAVDAFAEKGKNLYLSNIGEEIEL